MRDPGRPGPRFVAPARLPGAGSYLSGRARAAVTLLALLASAPALARPGGGGPDTFQGGFYAGTQGDGVPIAGNLFRGPSAGTPQRVWGEYWYATSVDALTLDGRIDAGGEFTLRETAPAARDGGLGLETGRLEGRLDAEQRVAEGTWRSADGKRSAPFRVERLAVYRWIQEHLAQAGRTQAPLSGFSWRYPQFENPRWASLNETLEATARAALAEYEEEIAEESGAAGAGRATDLPAEYTLASVQLVTDTLVSVRYDRTEYWPGAVHPNQCRYGVTYWAPDDDITPPRAVELRDLLQLSPDCERMLMRRLEDDLRRQGASEPEAVFLGAFSLLRRGLVFHYSPFDVGSYGEGGWNVYVPYTALARCVPQASPLQGLVRDPGTGSAP